VSSGVTGVPQVVQKLVMLFDGKTRSVWSAPEEYVVVISYSFILKPFFRIIRPTIIEITDINAEKLKNKLPLVPTSPPRNFNLKNSRGRDIKVDAPNIVKQSPIIHTVLVFI
jgi:hypothetical protein